MGPWYEPCGFAEVSHTEFVRLETQVIIPGLPETTSIRLTIIIYNRIVEYNEYLLFIKYIYFNGIEITVNKNFAPNIYILFSILFKYLIIEMRLKKYDNKQLYFH